MCLTVKYCCRCSTNNTSRKLFIQIVIFNAIFLCVIKDIFALPYAKQQRCSNRLESALEQLRRRSLQVKSSRTYHNQSPYMIYHSLYGPQNYDYDPPQDDYFDNHRRVYGKAKKPVTSGIIGITDTAHTQSDRNQHKPYNQQKQPYKLSVARVEVEDLRVKVPPSAAARWVEIDKCRFSTQNSTLDTRLIFPDLTISGKVVLQPSGGKCHMILRLRHAGIEFRTVPIGFDSALNEESRRISSASVRTDSHFAEPGFISVFAHGCQGPSGIKYRQNSKRRFGFSGEQIPAVAPEIELSAPQVVMGSSDTNRWGKLYNPYKNYKYDTRSHSYANTNLRDQDLQWGSNEADSHEFYDPNGDTFYHKSYQQRMRLRRNIRTSHYQEAVVKDEVHFNDDILNFSDDNLDDLVQTDARAFADLFSSSGSEASLSGHGVGIGAGGGGGNNLLGGDREEINDAFTNELEKLFSMGVRSLLTTYMQRALQPAIKETLMENMGYTISYG